MHAYDRGKRYKHMTTNLAESINSVLKGSRSLPICALVKTIFERTNAWFVAVSYTHLTLPTNREV